MIKRGKSKHTWGNHSIYLSQKGGDVKGWYAIVISGPDGFASGELPTPPTTFASSGPWLTRERAEQELLKFLSDISQGFCTPCP